MDTLYEVPRALDYDYDVCVDVDDAADFAHTEEGEVGEEDKIHMAEEVDNLDMVDMHYNM